ncbi:MAG: transposase [Bacteroidota bacterium]
MPPHGTYKGGPDGFRYVKESDHYLCPKGQGHTLYQGLRRLPHGNQEKKEYRARKHVCTGCPLRSECLGKSAQEKKFGVTYYRAEYERNNERVNGSLGRYMKGKRQSTVEPVFGTLTQHMGLRKMNTIGLAQANKCMHLSAMAYNLKKYLKFGQKHTKSGASALVFLEMPKTTLSRLFLAPLMTPRQLTVAFI